MRKYFAVITLDRVLFIMFTIFWAFLAWTVIQDWSDKTITLGPWFLSLLWVIILAMWALKGKKIIEIGYKGQLLFLNQRMNYYFKTEGSHWALIPFDIKVSDCREQVMKLDTLEAITSDDVKVFLDGTITFNIVELHKYSDVKEEGIKQGIDDVRDQILRVQVASSSLEDVLKMHADLGEKMHAGLQDSSDRWGIKIIEVIITKVITDPKVAEDLELQAREQLQKKGQRVEAEFNIELVALFEKPVSAGGGGLSHGEAVEMMQLTTGKAAPKNITGFTFSPEILQAVAEILRRK